MSYPIVKVNDVIHGKLLNSEVFPGAIEHLLFDSRKIRYPRTSLFFAITRNRNDGHKYISDCYGAGVRNFVVTKGVSTNSYPQANFLLVKNSIIALQKLATFHRRQFCGTTIGITGSNGKTIVKEWLYQLLEEDYQIVRSPKSFNSQIGVPLSVWGIEPHHDLAIFEAGISRKGEMANLEAVIDPTIGIFTNIGPAHSDGFGSLEEKVQEKFRLFQNVKTLIYCKDHELIDRHAPKHRDKQLLTWSRKENADLIVNKTEKTTTGKTNIEGEFEDQQMAITIPFTDDGSIENAIHCWLMMLHLGYSPKAISRRMQRLEPVEMRLEMKAGINDCTIINDSYNSDLTSLAIALDFLDQQTNHPHRILILSDILQSGQEPKSLYREVARLAGEKKIDRVIGIGKYVHLTGAYLPKPIAFSHYENVNVFLEKNNLYTLQNASILLKGARPFLFEKIANKLALKAHQTALEIDLSAVAHNLQIYTGLLNPGTRIMAMVKAAAYGSGGAELARLLEFHQVDYLAVAYPDEGVELRRAGVTLPILVLNPDEASFDTIIRHDLEPEIYNLRQLNQFRNFISGYKKSFPVQIKLDTGMHRLGFEEADLPDLIHLLKNTSQIRVKAVFSHLAASEDANEDAFTHKQAEKFNFLYQKIAVELEYQPLRHLLNSSGIVRFPQYHLDMVRLGIGLYGMDSSLQLQDQLQNVLTLKAHISQIKPLLQGETIGYGRMGKAEKSGKIATISIGYADGLPRRAGNGRYHVLVQGQLAPTIGNICMDMSMIDISHIPKAREGDEVIIFGKELSVQKLARCAETIPYEIFTGISGRVKRIYFQE